MEANIKSDHEPILKEKLFFLFSGAFISTPFPLILTSISEHFLTDSHGFWLSIIPACLVAPIVEEFAKAYPLFYRHGESEKSLFKLGFLTGLGFGVAEFLLYVFFYHVSPLIRLPALLFHATNTSIVAYGISINQALKYYLIAISFHFLNNFTSNFGILWYIGGISATLSSYILAIYLRNRTTDRIID